MSTVRPSIAGGGGALQVPVLVLPHGQGLPLPAYQSEGAAGLDLMAAIEPDAVLILAPGGRKLVPTGLVLALPPHYEAQVRPRSGLALKHGVTVLNAPGTIDADYRGEVQVLLINLGASPHQIRRGDRIAQMVVTPVVRAVLEPVASLDRTARGGAGFGSTGVSQGSSA
jgi:dUTP pyrophosphatase